MTRVRIAIIGCGAIAEEMHIPCALAVPEVELCALVDTDPEKRNVLASRYGVPFAVSTVAEIARHVDAAIIATPPHVRTSVASSAMTLGLHVLCEKPLANLGSECDELIRIAHERSRTLAVGHMFRFYPVRRRLSELISKHGLGAIRRVTASEGKPYNWRSHTGYTFRREMVSGGVLINAGIHTIDSILWWLGNPSAFEYEDDSLGGLESNFRLHMWFENDVQAVVRQSRTCSLPDRIVLDCEDGRLEFNSRSVSHYNVSVRAGMEAFTIPEGPQTPMECWKLQLLDFVDAVTNGREPFVSGEEGARAVKLIDQLYAVKAGRGLPSCLPGPGATW